MFSAAVQGKALAKLSQAFTDANSKLFADLTAENAGAQLSDFVCKNNIKELYLVDLRSIFEFLCLFLLICAEQQESYLLKFTTEL